MKRLASGVIAALALGPVANEAYAAPDDEPAHETAAQCRSRLGSELDCFQGQAFYYQTICALKDQLAAMKPDDVDALNVAATCRPEAKRATRPFYDALAKRLAKKPAAAAAAKRAMAAFVTMMDDPAQERRWNGELKKALADLGLEM